jgi:hypothetical protein
MEKLDISQQIKMLKERRLFIKVVRCPSEKYDSEKPATFDRHVGTEDIYVNNILNYLLKEIAYLSKEIMLLSGDGKVIPKELWVRLKGIQKLVKEQRRV